MMLLIDIGNTRLKWATTDHNGIQSNTAIAIANINKTNLSHLWQSIPKPELIGIACVGSIGLLDKVASVAKALWPGISVIQAKSQNHQLGVSNAYSLPERLGVDRWLAMVAAYNHYRKPLCVVGCGTAITLDIVDASGQHLGGLISPGLRLMKEALSNNTENLGLSDNPFPYGLANMTDAAIHNGTLSAACGFIEHVLQKQTGEPLLLLMTGGDADAIAAQLGKPATLIPDLIMQGLALTLSEQL